jgi:hypothetical protein
MLLALAERRLGIADRLAAESEAGEPIGAAQSLPRGLLRCCGAICASTPVLLARRLPYTHPDTGASKRPREPLDQVPPRDVSAASLGPLQSDRVAISQI